MFTKMIIFQFISGLLMLLVAILFIASWLYIVVDRFLQTIPMFAN